MHAIALPIRLPQGEKVPVDPAQNSFAAGLHLNKIIRMMRSLLLWLCSLLVCLALTDFCPAQPAKDQPKDQAKQPNQPPPQPKKPAFNPDERRPPAPEYALAFLGTILVLLILCMPSRKGY